MHDERREESAAAHTGPTLRLPARRPPAAQPGALPPLPPRSTIDDRRGRRRRWRLLLLPLFLLLVTVALLYAQLTIAANRVVTADARTGLFPALPMAGFNVLLVGVDQRAGHSDDGVRSDTLIVVHVDPVGRRMALLSVPRDTRVDIRDLGVTKVNAAYAHGYNQSAQLFGPSTSPQQGGMALAAETVESLLDVRIDYTAQINFEGFARVIDAIGGVTIDVPRRIVDDAYPTEDFGTTQVLFEPGSQRMDGARALIYARTRHADNDFGRNERQQQVLRAIVREIRGRGTLGLPLLLPRLLDSLQGTLSTTLPVARPDVLLAIAAAASGPDALALYRLTPETVPGSSEAGTDLIWNTESLHALVATFLARPDAATEAARVLVLNGAGITGLAGRVTAALERDGYRVLPPADAPTADVSRTVVYDVNSKPVTSRQLADRLRADLREDAPPAGADVADIVIVLGRDAADREGGK